MLFFLLSSPLAAPVVAHTVTSADLAPDDTTSLTVDRLAGTVWRMERTAVQSTCGWKNGEQTQEVVTFVDNGGKLSLRFVDNAQWTWPATVLAADHVGVRDSGGEQQAAYEWAGWFKGDLMRLSGVLTYAGSRHNGGTGRSGFVPCAAAFEVKLKPLK